jgi:hypothetical protein
MLGGERNSPQRSLHESMPPRMMKPSSATRRSPLEAPGVALGRGRSKELRRICSLRASRRRHRQRCFFLRPNSGCFTLTYAGCTVIFGTEAWQALYCHAKRVSESATHPPSLNQAVA